MKITFMGGYEKQIAFACIGVAPVILNVGDSVEIPNEIYEAEFKDDPRFKAEKEKTETKKKGEK